VSAARLGEELLGRDKAKIFMNRAKIKKDCTQVPLAMNEVKTG
jgi:hypothetical protein